MTVYNTKELETKSVQISHLEEMQKNSEEKLDKMQIQLNKTNHAIEEANKSWRRLEDELKKIDKATGQYDKKLEDLKNENKETKDLLDTRLPIDIKRLLMEATGTKD